MKKGILTSLGLAAVLTLGLASVNEYREVKEVDAASTIVEKSTFSEVSGKLDDVVSYSTDKGGGTSAPAINGSVIRIYQNSAGTGGGTITLTAAEGYLLKSVTIGSSMATKIAYTLGTSTTKSTAESLAANDKYSVNDIDENSITFYCMGTSSSSRLYVNYLSATYESNGSEPETPLEPEAADFTTELKPLFEKYYNSGEYDKHTIINLNSNAQNELKSQFHASVNTLERNTYYRGNALWMENGDGYSYYGTDETETHMTSGKVSNIGDVSNSIAVRNTTMEQYYATLHDFKEGEHNSVHSNNETLNLKTGWEVLDGVYTSEDPAVIDAFRLFTAPLWIGKTTENANYIPFKKATVEEDGNKLVMKLYVDGTDAEGKLTVADGVFSQAEITLPKPEISSVTFDFDEITAKSSTALNNAQALVYFTDDSSALTSVSVTYVYEGNGSSGQWQDSGCLKMGKSGEAGKLVLTFDAAYTFTTVKITCHDWLTTKSNTIKVNGGDSQALPKTGNKTTELTFNIEASNVITIETSERAFIFGITVEK